VEGGISKHFIGQIFLIRYKAVYHAHQDAIQKSQPEMVGIMGQPLAECFPDGRVSISDNGNGSVNVVVTGTTPSNLDEKIPVPAGVGRIVTTVPNPPPAPG
jgi:hypothetical protein